MVMVDKKKESINSKALKAGLWYTICNVLIRGMNFLTTPIFTRLLTKTDYGMYSNYTTWLGLLTTLTTLDLYVSIARAKFDYKDDIEGYISSIQCLGTLFTGGCYVIICLFPLFFQSVFGLDMIYIHILFLYLLVSPAFQILQEKHRQFMKYKLVSALTIVSTLATVICSLLLVITMENKLLGRVIGNTVVLFCICVIIYAYNQLKGKRVSLTDWKYALAIAVPYIPHILAGNIMGTTDKIIITHFWGAEYNALYSIVFTCSLIVTMVGSSINQAWSPWLFAKLSTKSFDDIRKTTKMYLYLTLPVMSMIFLIGPELVWVFGGEEYMECVSLVPCVMMGCYMIILYTFFVNVEMYYKKTLGISTRTVISGLFNLITNLIFIPTFGYTAAAYTTLASYILLFVLHYSAGIKLGAKNFYDLQQLLYCLLFMSMVMACSLYLYRTIFMRYCICAGLIIIIVTFIVGHRKVIIDKIREL